MSQQANLDLINGIYDAFGRGDVDHILNQLSDDVAWTTHLEPEVPWAGDFSGKASVPRFFQAIFDSVEVLGFDPTEFHVTGDAVVSLGTFECRAKNGKSAKTRWSFIWKIDGGKVTSYEQFHDPAITEIFKN